MTGQASPVCGRGVVVKLCGWCRRGGHHSFVPAAKLAQSWAKAVLNPGIRCYQALFLAKEIPRWPMRQLLWILQIMSAQSG